MPPGRGCLGPTDHPLLYLGHAFLSEGFCLSGSFLFLGGRAQTRLVHFLSLVISIYPVPAMCKALCWGLKTTNSLDRALQREQELSRKLDSKASAASTGTREAGESGGRPLLKTENVPGKGESALVGMEQGGIPKLPREGRLASITGYTTPCLGFTH